MAWSLCTKAQVQAIYKIDTASLKDFWSDTAEALIREHIHAPYFGLEQSVTEYHSGDGSSVLIVNCPPIHSVTSLSIDGTPIDSSEYLVFNTFIALTNSAFPEGNFNITVTYTSGGTVIPADISLACASMIAAIANYEGRQGTDGSLKWGDLPVGLAEETTNDNLGLVGHLKTIMTTLLKRYRVRIK